LNVTEAELKELELLKKQLQIAKEKQQDSKFQYEGYMIPEDEYDDRGKIDFQKKWKLLTARYERSKEEREYVPVRRPPLIQQKTNPLKPITTIALN
jgi:hypothetical protein